ncbi:MAG: protein-disulfide reductase DsbD family protein [Alphaproteobacteria bacterium]|nr:protein-disulfide reductase DsbD family protein [Alphaproteobacteria bacterium]
MQYWPPIRHLFRQAAYASLATLTLAIGAASSGFAQESAWDGNEYAAARLISATTAVGQDESLRLGLQFRMEPGWKIYWRSPGDAGLPPVPDWSQSDNVDTVTMQWPVPSRFEIFDIGTLGYEDAVVFPLIVAPTHPGAPVDLKGEIDFLVCAEICIPGHASLALSLPTGTPALAQEAHLIDRFRATVPATDAAMAGLTVTNANLDVQPQDQIDVGIAVTAQGSPFTDPDAFVEGPGGAYFDKPKITLSDDKMSAVLHFTAPTRMTLTALKQDGITVTIVDGPRALESHVIPSEAALPLDTAMAQPSDRATLWTILGIALLGGLILNLMPCVLPVLSLKLMSVMSKSGKDKASIRAGFLASSAGIILSFLALAGAAIGVKEAGLSVGWGIQFQQPVFLALMVALVTLFACNLLGLFEFRLPGRLGDRAAAMGAGHNSLFHDFLTGAFATLLATPCSAPFLGTAVGFALSAGPMEILAVFTALGLGLALPYLMVALVPDVVRFLPRPGRWMMVLKIILALALAGTAIWLLTVISATLGAENALAIGALALLAALVLATRKIGGSRLGRASWPISAVLALAAVLAPLTMAPHIQAPMNQNREDATGIQWQQFDPAAISGLVTDGKTVFVDVTADWCVTCQWNKKTVVEVGAVADWLAGPNVIAMKADWTQPDPVIADFLAQHGRYGIPFNIVYGPAAPQGIALPELLSANAVKSAAVQADPGARIAAMD